MPGVRKYRIPATTKLTPPKKLIFLKNSPVVLIKTGMQTNSSIDLLTTRTAVFASIPN